MAPTIMKMLGAALIITTSLLAGVTADMTVSPQYPTVHTTQTHLALRETPIGHNHNDIDTTLTTLISDASVPSMSLGARNSTTDQSTQNGECPIVAAGCRDACPPIINGTLGSVIACKCYGEDAGFGVGRSYMIDAITAACKQFNLLQFGPGHLFDKNYAHFWDANNGLIDGKGTIVVRLSWMVDWVITPDDPCSAANQAVEVWESLCFDGMHTPIDDCDQGGENGKHGGYGTDSCLMWTVDPNPQVNNPTLLLPGNEGLFG